MHDATRRWWVGLPGGWILGTTGKEPRADRSGAPTSSLTAVILFYLYTWILEIKWPLESSQQALAVGIIWLCLTVAFEFFFGHYVANHPWSRLIQDYNLLSGRLWALVLLAVTAAPYVVYKLQY